MRIKQFVFLFLFVLFYNPTTAETLKEYADQCTTEIGVAVPAFNCQTFEVAQKEGNTWGSGPCDFPNRLNRQCDPGSRIKILHNDDNVAIVASCRKVGESTNVNDPYYNDIAVIQQNKKNGATCFYQALNHQDGSVVPSPSSPPVPGAAFTWLSPSGTANIDCVACHDNGAFIRSPYMASSLNFPSENIGGSTVTSNSDGDPYWFVGSDFQSHWKTYSVFVKDNACIACHRLSVSTIDGVLQSGSTTIQNFGNSNSIESGTPFHRSTAMDFSLIATAGKEISKSAHSNNSPIWMPPGHTSYDLDYAKAAKEISDCAHQFTNANSLPNSDSCRITPHPKPVLNILFPITTDTENAGDRTNPGKIWVHIDPPVGALFDVNQYTVKVAGVTANIISGSQVGHEFWMVVQPVANNTAVPTAGLYDLEVTVKVPGSSDQTKKETKAVYLGDPGVPVDMVIVGDVSGSMGSSGKLEAAQNAARLYVDHASDGDKLAVVSFADSETLNMPLSDVTPNVLTDARDKITNDWSAGGQTALGSGLLEAANQLNSGDPSHQKRMAVLTDGNENVSPKWADGPSGSVQSTILDQPYIIDMVTLGNDADVNLAKDIATQTNGHYFRVDPASNVSLASTKSLNDFSLFAGTYSITNYPNLFATKKTSETIKPGFVATSQTINTMTLPNILADVYKSMAEDARKEQRIGDWNGQLTNVGEGDTYTITLESGLPEVLFAVNWNLPSQKTSLLINKLSCKRLGGQEIIDSTHAQCRINKPTPGSWALSVKKTSGNLATNYKLMVSAYSQTVLMPYLTKVNYEAGESLSLIAYVGNHKPPQQAVAFVNILMPNGNQITKQIYDDGNHDEGKSGDGYYGNTLTLSIAGTYALDYTATGINSDGVAFKRKVRRSVYVDPQVRFPYGLMAKESIVIGNQSKVTGPGEIFAGRSLELGNKASSQANALVPGYVTLHSDSYFDGNLFYSSGLTREPGSIVTGIIQLTTPETIPVFDSYQIPYGKRNITLAADNRGSWTPDSYRDGFVGSNSKLTLTGGTYRFRSLTINTDATIETQGGKTGPTLIFVEEQISINDKNRIESACISCLVIYNNSKIGITLKTSTEFRGTLVVPNGVVNIGSTKNTFVNVVAKQINVETNANISINE